MLKVEDEEQWWHWKFHLHSQPPHDSINTSFILFIIIIFSSSSDELSYLNLASQDIMEIKETSKLKEQDTISTLLPDDMLLHILSFLDMSSVIRATQALKGQKHLWSHMNVLRFDEGCHELVSLESFEEFVKVVLEKRKDCNIDTFDIYCTLKNTDLIFSWISSVLKHHVQHLSIFFTTSWDDMLPEAVFKCESLKSFRIGRGGRQGLKIPLAIDYNGLTLLELNACLFLDADGNYRENSRLVLNFPLLEELKLTNCEIVEEFTILAPKLKIFKFSQHYDQVRGWLIRLYMPCLELFVCDDYTECEQKFFFLCELPALIKAQISTHAGVYDEFLQEYADPAFSLLQHMQNAKELDLLGGQLVDILSQSSQLNNWPIARHSLCSLKLSMMRTEKSAYTLFYILSASPNIKYLEVEPTEVPDWFSNLVISQSMGQPAEEVTDANSESMVVSLLDYCIMERLEVIKIRDDISEDY